MELTEYHCDFCKLTFYAPYGKVNCCPYCKSTSEINDVKNITLEKKETLVMSRKAKKHKHMNE